ncbi:hypothetical protein Memar_0219 [Methanoculleus marisnigri JR1]|uniref:Uncharacterized protein n=1 Tax=Methanoculleus marisnigri (strain ATCC 35101 / DSM 1498 / JR1) TaxID=368407 RepID=A3CS03_METMJ|nr:hypothetical protein Memar_0219 [Methanoculleus marisnigri JR1]
MNRDRRDINIPRNRYRTRDEIVPGFPGGFGHREWLLKEDKHLRDN